MSETQQPQNPQQNDLPYPIAPQPNSPQTFYPGLAEFMGLELSESVIRENMPEYLRENQQALLPRQSVS